MVICRTFFFSNVGQKNVFYDILERKNAFLDYKKKEVEKVLKLSFFQKGVNPWFLSKNGHIPPFFLGNVGHENVFYDILERTNVFLDYKNKNLEKLEKLTIFQRG